MQLHDGGVAEPTTLELEQLLADPYLFGRSHNCSPVNKNAKKRNHGLSIPSPGRPKSNRRDEPPPQTEPTPHAPRARSTGRVCKVTREHERGASRTALYPNLYASVPVKHQKPAAELTLRHLRLLALVRNRQPIIPPRSRNARCPSLAGAQNRNCVHTAEG